MYAVERSHLASHDWAWLPASLRRKAWAASSAVVATAGLVSIGTIVAVPASLVLWKVFAAGGVGAAVVSERMWQATFRRELDRLSRGQVPLADLQDTRDGALVCVRGRIEATAPLAGVLHEVSGVYRRIHLYANPTMIFEAAVDFELVDDQGGRIVVQAGGARWITPTREPFTYPRERFDAMPDAPALRDRVRDLDAPRIRASERVLELGAEVQIVGYKTESAHVDGVVRDYRLPPQRTTLCSGAALPLVITRVSELPT